MAITERPDAANDDTAPRADPAPAQPAAPYLDCLTPMLEQPEAPPGDASRSTGWPEEFIRGCRFGFQHPDMAWPAQPGRGRMRKFVDALRDWLRRQAS